MTQTNKDFDKDFDLEKLLNEVKGPLIEIGGPTQNGYDLVNFKKLNKKLLVSNVFPGHPVFIDWQENSDYLSIKYFGRVNFIADALNLPISDNTAGAIFASYFGGGHCKSLALSLKKRRFQPAAQHGETAIPNIKLTHKNKAALVRERNKMRRKAITEAWRVLEPEGLLVWQGGNEHDSRFAKKNGFEALFIGLFFYSQIFRKIVANRETP